MTRGEHDHHQVHRDGRPRGGGLTRYARDFLANWDEHEASLPRKLMLTVRNRFIAFALLRGCCGHRGEPGC